MKVTKYKTQNRIDLWDAGTKLLHDTKEKIAEYCAVGMIVAIGGKSDRQWSIDLDSRDEVDEAVKIAQMMGAEETTETPPPTGRYANN